MFIPIAFGSKNYSGSDIILQGIELGIAFIIFFQEVVITLC